MLNQNYPRCIFIRTDCEIWAVKTWVIVALETDITHFPSRSRQWHANSVFNVCVWVCVWVFVWLLCKSVKELEDEVDWKDVWWWEEGVGGRWELYQGVTCSFCHTWRRNQAAFLHIFPLHTCVLQISYHLSPRRPLIQPSAPSGSPLRGTDVPWRVFSTWEKRKSVKKNNGCTGSVGIEINPAPGVCEFKSAFDLECDLARLCVLGIG